jgi:organic hydroperoxide reductase OsmC/OhrA
MIQYPLRFQVSSKASSGVSSAWTTQASMPSPLACAIPPEFEGPGRGFSPEDFFALAVANCFIATFKVIAERSRVEFAAIEVRGDLVVDRDAQGRPWMSEMKLVVKLDPGSGDPDRLTRLLEKTAQGCLVANSVKTKVEFRFEVEAA